MFRRVRLSLLAVFTVFLATTLSAQSERTVGATVDPATPAHVASLEGAVTLVRDGRSEPVAEGAPLLEGDHLATADGRVEILLPDASVLALDGQTTVDLLAGGLVRLSSGRLAFVVSREDGETSEREYRVDTRAGSIRLTAPGEYRISILGRPHRPEVELAVVQGEATLDGGGVSTPVLAGERAVAAEGQAAGPVHSYNVALADAFYDWTDARRRDRVGSTSNAYLPQNLQAYGGAFDRGGTWQDSPDHGWVWYPRVPAGWRPYYDGSWRPYSWGWTWVGAGAWSWPTHHYGRWGFGVGGWFWIPAAAWGPAWVSWSVASDYVGWCPLGWDDRPVFGRSSGSYWYGRHRYSAWDGWTTLPYRSLAAGDHVPRHAVSGDALPAATRHGFAVPRGGTVGGVAVSRPTSSQHAAGDPGASARPSVAERRWTTATDSPYGRAQEVAGERLSGGRVVGSSPYPDRYRSAVPSPFGGESTAPAWRRPLVGGPWGGTGGSRRGGFSMQRSPAATPRVNATPRGGGNGSVRGGRGSSSAGSSRANSPRGGARRR